MFDIKVQSVCALLCESNRKRERGRLLCVLVVWKMCEGNVCVSIVTTCLLEYCSMCHIKSGQMAHCITQTCYSIF